MHLKCILPLRAIVHMADADAARLSTLNSADPPTYFLASRSFWEHGLATIAGAKLIRISRLHIHGLTLKEHCDMMRHQLWTRPTDDFCVLLSLAETQFTPVLRLSLLLA